MNNSLFEIFFHFKENILISTIFILFLIMYITIFILQLLKKDNILISILMGLLLGVLFFIATTLMNSNSNPDNGLLTKSLNNWFTLVWNIFMFMLLTVLPLYVFSMVSTTFTNTRHYKNGKKLLITSFFSLWGMTLLGVLIAISFIPLLILLKDFIQIDIVSETGTSKTMIEIILQYYSFIVLSSIILAIIFAIVMNFLHKKFHNIGERFIFIIEKIRDTIRMYLNYVSKLVPYIISGMLILLFNNFENAFVTTLSTLSIFIFIFFIGLFFVSSIELSIIKILRKNKDSITKKEFNKKTFDYTMNVFAVQSAPILYPITYEYVEGLGVDRTVSETIPTLSSFMGYSMCGGFYPALIIIFTLMQSNASINGNEISNLITISLMVPLILIMTLGMTGVPGADVAIILGLLSTLGLNPNYFFKIYLVEPLLDKFRGIGNSYGFAASAVITERICNGKDKFKNNDEEIKKENIKTL